MTLRSRALDRGTVLGFRTGWGAVRRLPGPAAYRMFDRLADLTVRRDTKGVRRLRSNYARVRPELAADELERLVRAGMRSYLRYFCDAFRLPDWGGGDLAERVRLSGAGAARLDRQVAAGERVVLFTGHQGNWDSAAAWSARHLAPVTTVAERLKPEEVFQAFLDFRRSIGITILPLTGGPPPFPRLREAVRPHSLVALLADRDLTSRGVEVNFCGHPSRMARGPALLALLEDATLYAAGMHYDPVTSDEPGFGGRRLVIDVSEPIPVPGAGDTASRVAVMTQACADHLGAVATRHTEDWHMLQRVFLADLTPRN